MGLRLHRGDALVSVRLAEKDLLDFKDVLDNKSGTDAMGLRGHL